MWSLLIVAVFQLGLAYVIEHWQPGLRYPEYGSKLARLRARIAEAPGQPLVLFLGTSRTMNAFDPAAALAAAGHNGPRPVVFNFGHTGAGPLHQYLLLRRLLDKGITPEHIFIELLPPLLASEIEADFLLKHRRLIWADWPALERLGCFPRPPARWCWENLIPWETYREHVLSRYVPRLLAKWQPDQTFWNDVDPRGYLAHPRKTVSAEEYRRGLKRAHAEHAHLLKDFRVSAASDRALRELLKLCRANDIGVTLVLMPEGSDFRRWYSPRSLARLEEYLSALCREHDLPLVDARKWVEDGGFADGHHVLAEHADAFSRRFGREVLRPVLRSSRGEEAASNVRASGPSS